MDAFICIYVNILECSALLSFEKKARRTANSNTITNFHFTLLAVKDMYCLKTSYFYILGNTLFSLSNYVMYSVSCSNRHNKTFLCKISHTSIV